MHDDGEAPLLEAIDGVAEHTVHVGLRQLTHRHRHRHRRRRRRRRHLAATLSDGERLLLSASGELYQVLWRHGTESTLGEPGGLDGLTRLLRVRVRGQGEREGEGEGEGEYQLRPRWLV